MKKAIIGLSLLPILVGCATSGSEGMAKSGSDVFYILSTPNPEVIDVVSEDTSRDLKFTDTPQQADLTINIYIAHWGSRICEEGECDRSTKRGGFPESDYPSILQEVVYIPAVAMAYDVAYVIEDDQDTAFTYMVMSGAYYKDERKYKYRCRVYRNLDSSVKKSLIDYCIDWAIMPRSALLG